MWAHGARDDLQSHNLHAVVHMGDTVIDERLDVFIIDVFLFVSEGLEPVEGVFQGILAEVIAQILKLRAERRSPRMFAHDERGFSDANRLWRHDLVGFGMLQYTVLMNTALMSKGISANDCFVVLHRKICHRRDQSRGARKHFSLDTSLEGQQVVAGANSHHDLFERGISGPFAKTVDRAFDLAGTSA